MNARLARLRALLPEKELDALIVSQAENRRYLSGFVGTAGYLIVTASRAILATDFRYTEQARTQARDFEVVQIKGEASEWLPQMAGDLGLKKVGFESMDLSFYAYRRLTEAIGRGQGWQLIPTERLVEGLRATKDAAEMAALTRAAHLADLAAEHLEKTLRPGVQEKEVAWQMESFLRESGSEFIPFELIIASGPNAALPHAHPAERRIAEGEPVIMDIGARVDGYCSDLSRTFFLGKPDDTFRRVYDIVLGAQLTAIATLKPGMTGEEADRLARTVIEQGGYGDNFGHGLGHGVGLAVHEEPRLGMNSKDVLSDNMVFTVEPGVYLPGWGGVRIEDMVVIDGGKVRPLTGSRKVYPE